MGLTATEPAWLGGADSAGSPQPPPHGHPRLSGRGTVGLAPLLWQEGGKGLRSRNDPTSLAVRGRVRDADIPGPPSLPCRRPVPVTLAPSLRQSRPRSPCNKARALWPSVLHTMATQVRTSYSSHPTCRKMHLHSQASRESCLGAEAQDLENTECFCMQTAPPFPVSPGPG